MSERQDDTTQPRERDAPPEPERAPRNYYYDDGTGYEVYDPATDTDEPDESDAGEAARDAEDAAREDDPRRG
ncbi:MAG TPA: hypothetical protein VK388_06130 [Pyrinomonadaceae bacterium]|nr:hypothetical protein [Pyrinomonadaceae bacterium]